MNMSAMVCLTLLCSVAAFSAQATDTVVIGRLLSDEPMSYVQDKCVHDEPPVCMHSWWKDEIQVERTLSGPRLSGRITVAVVQHVGLNARFKEAVRLFVLTRIVDAGQRAKLRVDYQLVEASEPHQMFCLSQDPKELGLAVDQALVSHSRDDTNYCFELPSR